MWITWADGTFRVWGEGGSIGPAPPWVSCQSHLQTGGPQWSRSQTSDQDFFPHIKADSRLIVHSLSDSEGQEVTFYNEATT